MTEDKQQLAAEIGKLETWLAQEEQNVQVYVEGERTERATAIGGLIALLLGALAFLFLTGLWSIPGAALGIFGLLAMVGGLVSRANCGRKRREAEASVARRRGQLAELRARMMI